MANEVWMMSTPGLGTVKAELRAEDRRMVWNGSAFALLSTLTVAQWQAALLTLTEQTTADGVSDGVYVGSMPAGTVSGEYVLRAFTGAAPSPVDESMAEQAVAWRVKEITLEDISDDLDHIVSHGDTFWAGDGSGGGGLPSGEGDVLVNHDFVSGVGLTLGSDALKYVDPDGSGIDNAVINAYTTTDYDAGHRTQAYILAQSLTDAEGRWVRDMMLDPGAYTLLFYKQEAYGNTAVEITVVEEV